MMPKIVPWMLKGLVVGKMVPQLSVSSRALNLYEYQSKKLMAVNGIDVQRFKMAETPQEASLAGKELLSTFAKELVIKAQVLAGGRGKGTFSNSKLKGGIQLTKDANVVFGLTSKMLGDRLITKQTGKEGVVVHKLMIAEALDIVKETYVAILLDRSAGGPVIVASPCGGVDIEEVAETQPHNILKVPVNPCDGLNRTDAAIIAEKLQFSGAKADIVIDQLFKLYYLFKKYDCTMLEVNPLGETPDGRIVCFDSKIVFDESASFRHRDLFDSEDTSEMDQREVKAAKLGLNFVSLTGSGGNIGCMVNGAGLAMATMDVIKLHGGEPANFLDLGGTVGDEQVSQALQLLHTDPNVRAILVNIFGGIVNCETIANGIINVCKTTELKCPLVVRLQGTNVDSARSMLAKSGLKIISASDLTDAAVKAVQQVA